MKIYARGINYDFDPNGDERFASDLDQFVGQDVWVRVTYSAYGRDRDVWIRPLRKTYNGNVYWEFNQIDFDKHYNSIPEFIFDSKRPMQFYYNRLHVTDPIELASTEDLMEHCGLYDKDKETEEYLDSIIGQDKWVHVYMIKNLDGKEYFANVYIKILSRKGDEYIYNVIYSMDVDDPSSQYSDYTRSGIKKLLSKKQRNAVSNFGIVDDTTYTTAEVEKALDKPWLEE